MAFISNPKVREISLMSVVVLVTLWAVPSARTTHIDAGKEYTLMVGGEELRFTARPELGYVVKLKQDTSSIDALSRMLMGFGAVDISPIRGLGRKGTYIVYNKCPATQNDKTIKLLRIYSDIKYKSPLFSSYGETVAIIPEIVIRVKPGTEIVQVQALCDTSSCKIIKLMEFTKQEYLLEVLGPDAEAVFADVEQLGQAPCVEWACPNTASKPKLCSQSVSYSGLSDRQLEDGELGQDANNVGVFPNDEYFPLQWHLHNTGQSGGTPGADIRATEAWEITTGDPNIVIAVFDTGVDSNHPDLISNLIPGYDFVQNDDIANPVSYDIYNAHGTGCAGIIGAQGNNGMGVTGVAWNCKLMPIRVAEWRTDETWYTIPASDIATSFRWAATNEADIFSNSWIALSSNQPAIHSAIVDITKFGGLGRNGKGCVFLALAGNESGPISSYPQKYPEVITVGAADHNDLRCSYSNFGPELDIVTSSGWQVSDEDFAKSKGIGSLWTTDLSGPAGWNFDLDPNVLDYTAWTGTCGACSVAAGVAALILSVEPNLTSEEVHHFLERSAKDLGDPGWDDYYGWGRVDARAALDMVLAKRADLNDDWKVDLEDLLILIEFWGTEEPSADIAPVARCDGIVDVQDLELIMEHWQEQIPELGLVARWKLDETEGMFAIDSTSDNDGALHGEPQWQPAGGIKGGALQLDGIDDYISTAFVLDPSAGPFSVCTWIQSGSPGNVVMSQIDGIGGSGETWLGTEPLSGKLMTGLVALPLGRFMPKPLVSETIITDNQWHHIGFVWDGAYRSLYVNGVEVAKDTVAQKPLKIATGGLYIGAGKNLESGTFFSGLIDDIRIYNRALSVEDIQKLAQ